MYINYSVFPALSCTSFKVSGLILKCSIHFELILVQGERHGSSFSFQYADIQFSQQHLLKRLSFLHCMFLATVKNQIHVAAWISIVSLMFMFGFALEPCYFYCHGFVI
jgi:hypothetical protein